MTREELVEMKDRKSVYQKAIALTPGHYKVVEEYVDDAVSHCLEMLYGDGQAKAAELVHAVKEV